jgi:hypothetical protein
VFTGGYVDREPARPAVNTLKKHVLTEVDKRGRVRSLRKRRGNGCLDVLTED